jgi:trimeric autotransporter adhesin
MIKSILTLLMVAFALAACSSSGSNIQPIVALSAVTVNPSSATVAPGTTKQFQAVGLYSNGNQVDVTDSVTWSSSNPSVATVNSHGLATAVGPGSAQIRASMGAFSGAATLSTAAIQSIAITPPVGVPIVAGATNQQFTATATLSNGQTQDITNLATFSSNNTNIATIGATGTTGGQANFLTAGPTTISATAGGVTGTLPVTVLTMNNIDLQPATTASVNLGGTQNFTGTGTLSNGSTATVTPLLNFTSSNPAIATIGTNGALSAVGVGTTVVTAGFPGVVPQTSTVTVTPPTSITVTSPSPTSVVGSTQQLSATGNFSNGGTTNLTPLVTFSSSAPGVATVNSQGVVTAVGNGTATITASVPGSPSGTTTITVNSLSSLAITPTNPSVGVGSSVQLQAVGTFSDGSTQNVTNLANWTSSTPSVASVSNNQGTKGIVNGLSQGSTVITASFNGTASTTTVTVQQGVVTPGSEAFVTNFATSFLSVIDTGSNTIFSNVVVGPGPTGVAINPLTKLVYVANNGNGTVSVVDSSRNTQVTTIAVQAAPWGVAVDPATNRVYVSNSGAGTVSVIDGTSNSVITTIGVGSSPRNLTVSNGRLYVTNFNSNTVSVISTATNSLITTINVGQGPVDIASNPAGSLIYVVNSFSSTISVISTSNNTVVSTISVGSNAQGIAVSPALNEAYVTLGTTNSLAVIDTTRNSVIATIPVGASPKGVAVKSGTNRIYVANNGSNTVSVVDPTTRTVIATISGFIGPLDVAAP